MNRPGRTTTPTALAQRDAGVAGKTAARVADRIIADVLAAGWPVGQVMGSEGDLLERYEVSRAVFREAVRLVEHREVARTRRGPGGGLVVTEPTPRAVIEAVLLYLYRVGATLDEVFEARVVLEQISADAAMARLDDDDRRRLGAYAEASDPGLNTDPRTLHNLLAACTRNPAIELFVDVLNRVTLLYTPDRRELGPDLAAAMTLAHAKIAEAVLAGDSATARRRMRIHLDAEAEYLRARRTTRQVLPASVTAEQRGQGKRAEAVARRLAAAVVVDNLKPGDQLGTEAGLMEQQGVSRAVFREAVRLLEFHQIARMKRGPGGGLFVVPPSSVAVTDIVAIYLARHGMSLSQLSELRTAVEVELVGLAVDRIDERGRAALRDAVTSEPDADDEDWVHAADAMHAVVAQAASNRVLELVALVLIRLSRLHQVERLAPRSRVRTQQEVHQAHGAIADSVLAGDRDVARHRMQRHLDALGSVVR